MKVIINKEDGIVEVWDGLNTRFTACGMPETNGWRTFPLDSQNTLVITRSANGRINAWIENVPKFQEKFRWMYPK